MSYKCHCQSPHQVRLRWSEFNHQHLYGEMREPTLIGCPVTPPILVHAYTQCTHARTHTCTQTQEHVCAHIHTHEVFCKEGTAQWGTGFPSGFKNKVPRSQWVERAALVAGSTGNSLLLGALLWISTQHNSPWPFDFCHSERMNVLFRSLSVRFLWLLSLTCCSRQQCEAKWERAAIPTGHQIIPLRILFSNAVWPMCAVFMPLGADLWP